METFFEDPAFGPVRLVRSARARRISLRVHPRRGITLTLPPGVPKAAGKAFFEAKRPWLTRVLARQEAVSAALASEEAETDFSALRAAAKDQLPPRLAAWAERYGFRYGRVCIKHNLSNWGSCSSRGNINLNLNLMRLPEDLRDYVLLHELCHLRQLNHGPQFHALLDGLCRDGLGCGAASLEKRLRSWHLI